jgi:subtilase family serine protease
MLFVLQKLMNHSHVLDKTLIIKNTEKPDSIDLITNTLNLTKSTLNLSPNPAIDFIRLEIEGGNNRIQIVNSQGQVIYQEKTSEKILNIHTQNLAPGIYFVIVTNPNGTISKGKFVKL